MKAAAGLLVLAFLASIPAECQSAYVFETLTITPSTIATESATEMEYDTAEYYCASAYSYLWINSSYTSLGYAAAGPYCGGGFEAELTATADTEIGVAYELQTNHFLYAAYTEYYCDDGCEVLYYIDPYGFSEVTPQGFTGSGTVTSPDENVDASTYAYYIASTYLTANTYPPTITGIGAGYPADGVLNSSGYTVLYGFPSRWATRRPSSPPSPPVPGRPAWPLRSRLQGPGSEPARRCQPTTLTSASLLRAPATPQ